MQRPLLIVKTGVTVPSVAARRGDFEHMFTRAMGIGLDRAQVVNVFRDEVLPAPGEHGPVVVTGSAAMASEHAEWSDRTAEWLAAAVDAGAPVLAVCYGHQLLALGLGGKVGRNPRGREIGTVQVRLTAEGATDPLLGSLQPAGRALRVQATHVESVLELPPPAVRLGASDLDPHQAFRIGERAWGVQFHPELDADIVRGYITARADTLRSEGLDPEALAADAADSDDGRHLLERFVALAWR